jgi:hypothetical protein
LSWAPARLPSATNAAKNSKCFILGIDLVVMVVKYQRRISRPGGCTHGPQK